MFVCTKLLAVVGIVALLAIVGPAAPAWSAEPNKPPVKKGKTAKPAKKRGPVVGGDLAAKGKVCFGDAPTIETVKPDEVRRGDKVTITGKNFGAPGCLTSVSFGPGRPASFHHKNDRTVTAVVPTVKKKGLALLSVTTASGEASTTVLVK